MKNLGIIKHTRENTVILYTFHHKSKNEYDDWLNAFPICFTIHIIILRVS